MGEKLGRRTLVEWLGQGAVLALGAPLFKACAAAGPVTGQDAGALIADAGSPVLTDGGVPSGFQFQPGDGAQAIFDGWGERTVDPQSLTALLASWTLTIDGLVESPKTFRFLDLAALRRTDQVTDFHCVEGWSIYDVPWNGVPLSSLLDLARPASAATHVTFHTVNDLYNESLPLSVAREARTLLAYGIGGATLPLRHGFPARVVVPRLLGYKNAKFVYRVELSDHSIEGYWVQAGYPYAGEVPASRLRPGHY
ncbi:MAG: molybdopterin-dependent oxidoreductase [Myxococcales bacterium]